MLSACAYNSIKILHVKIFSKIEKHFSSFLFSAKDVFLCNLDNDLSSGCVLKCSELGRTSRPKGSLPLPDDFRSISLPVVSRQNVEYTTRANDVSLLVLNLL